QAVRPEHDSTRACQEVPKPRARSHHCERRRRDRGPRRAHRPGAEPLPSDPRHHPRAARLHETPVSASPADPRRRLPAVEALLAEPDVAALLATHPRSLVLRAVRETIDAARADGGAIPPEGWGPAVRARAHRLAAPSLGPVI